jgi:16S rRNA (guanine966-N2)-methyltransferase
MRIIAGLYKGRKLETLADDSVRPTADRVREALFNVLMHRYTHEDGTPLLKDSMVADIFCGSGALGLEAISRGAARCLFNDTSQQALNIARHNATKMQCLAQADFTKGEAANAPHSPPRKLVFLDPPYNKGLIPPTITALLKRGFFAADAVIVTETSVTEELELPLELDLTRDYGKSRVQFWLNVAES